MIQEDTSLYNQITVKNIDGEDFTFRVVKEHYMIMAGETRIFPKFMVRPLLKHLIDRILIKRDPTGKLLRVQKLRDELAARIVLHEEAFQRPVAPTDHEIVEKMNAEPELDRILKKNKDRLAAEVAPTNLVPPPLVNTDDLIPASAEPSTTKPAPAKVKSPAKKKEEVVETTSQPVEKFDQIEDEKNRPIPSRDEMLKYATKTLGVDLSDDKTKKAWDAMSDEKLYTELQLDQVEDLAELGFKS